MPKPDKPVARADDYQVLQGTMDAARPMVERWHYAKGCANTAVASHILWHRERGMVGAALWMPPTRRVGESVCRHFAVALVFEWAKVGTVPTAIAAVALALLGEWRNVLTLSRLVVAPGEPQNATGILLSRSMRLLPNRWHLLVTYADTRMGHGGTIYKATNWTMAKASKGDPTWVDASGKQVAKKCAGKSRRASEMLALGYQRIPAKPKVKFVYARRAA